MINSFPAVLHTVHNLRREEDSSRDVPFMTQMGRSRPFQPLYSPGSQVSDREGLQGSSDALVPPFTDTWHSIRYGAWVIANMQPLHNFNHYFCASS